MATAPSAVRSVPQGPRNRMALPPADAGALGAAKYCFLFAAFVRPDPPNVHIMVTGVTYLPQCGNHNAD
jgi:hypothetical protein